MTTWQEYIAEKQKLADRQLQAGLQKTPASRLVFYYSAILPNWRVFVVEVRKLDDVFINNDFYTMNQLSGSLNYLIAKVAQTMTDEIALRLAVENKELDPSKYKQAWWV
jgi:hypothetical protein